MRNITDVVHIVKNHAKNHKPIYLMGLILFAWTLFEAILAYITPIAVLDRGFTPIQMGLIMGCSSIFGAFFDFVLSKFLRNTTYRRLFLFMFLACAVYPLLLWKAETMTFYWIAMAAAGLFYDLKTFGTYDFVERYPLDNERSSTFGFLDIFRMLAYLVAPILAGSLALREADFAPYGISIMFLAVAFVLYLVLLTTTKKKLGRPPVAEHPPERKPVSLPREFKLWEKITVSILPILLFMILANIFDSTFWTIGPVFSEKFPNFPDFGGLFMTIYMASTLITGFFVGKITKRFGQKKTAFASFTLGAILVATFGFIQSPWVILAILAVASLISSLAWPASSGALSDYMAESPKFDREIAGISDFTVNIGYFVGPILAGIIMEFFGTGYTFTIVGITCAIGGALLYIFTPKSIKVQVKMSELPR